MRFMRSIVILTAVVGLLAGCPKRPAVVPDKAGDNAGESVSGTQSEGLQEGERLTAEQAAFKSLERDGLVIYFDFDTSEVKSEYRNLIAAHAKFLGDYPTRRLRLEGHADERGSREYNIGLGERRAQAVRRALMLQGAGDNQLTTLSYGEERPVVSGSDESAWSKNRRVELNYSP